MGEFQSPPAQEPATPSAFVILAASKPIRRPAATAAERPRGAGRVKAARLVGVLGGVSDPEHGLSAGDERGEEIAPAEARSGRPRGPQ